MKIRSLLAAVVLLSGSQTSMGWASCVGHNGPAGCDRASGVVLCADGTLDMRFRCSPGRKSQRIPKKRVLKMKPPSTKRGQILSPGEKPPPTSFENSK